MAFSVLGACTLPLSIQQFGSLPVRKSEIFTAWGTQVLPIKRQRSLQIATARAMAVMHGLMGSGGL
jgi:hypothetical protein